MENMSTTLPDNRIRFSPTKIDFTAEVGVTGQDHDSYPSAGSQARFDWMRMVIIGLLSNQSSFTEPSEKREGTLWFDLNNQELKIWDGSNWESIAKYIIVGDPATADSAPPTLW